MAVNHRRGVVLGGAVVCLVAVIVASASAGFLDRVFGRTPAETAKAAGVVETATQIKIPLSALNNGKALFLETAQEGRPLYYFALKGSDGAYRAALDACDVCYRSNKGYRQEGDWMVCNNCGQKFPSARIGEIKGGCNPHPLRRRVEGTHLVIDKADLREGKDYFPGKRS
ncbi:MAG: Fe-S-containing protein [Verrucomicrobiota bacterium]